MIARAVVLALVLAAPAQAAVPLARVESADVDVVLAGDTVVYTRADDEEVDVLAAPVGGPPGAAALLRVPLPRGESGSITLGASPQRVAAIVHVGETAQLFEGPPAGPLAPVSAPAPVSESAFAPFKVLVDGDHVLVAENRDGFRDPRYRIDGGDPFTLPGYVVGFAGDLVAYATDARRLVLRNWRTGAERVLAMRGQIVSFDLRADGAAVADLGDGTVLATSAAGAVTRVTTNGEQPRWAGAHIVYNGIFGLMIAEPGAKPRPFGPRTASLFVFDADERHIAWAAHGCLLAAPIGEPDAGAPGPGPCLQSEIWVDQREHAAIGRDPPRAAVPVLHGRGDGMPRNRVRAPARARPAAQRERPLLDSRGPDAPAHAAHHARRLPGGTAREGRSRPDRGGRRADRSRRPQATLVRPVLRRGAMIARAHAGHP